jgi:ectoine hydroxylase-related dioxygenase (phytanoyl-CoA dioxygenase family)
MATDARILDRVEQLIGSDLFIQHSKLNMKPAKVGSVVEWHQDLTYFPHTNDDLVTMLIYLDDANVNNGCLQVLPQKHHAYLNHCNVDGSFAGMVTDPIEEEPISLEAPAGSVILMHCLTPHCSLPNRSDRARRTLIFEYRAADSFPLYMGPMTGRNEEHAVLVRGKLAPFARLGSINPLIPHFAGKVTSLYDLQNRTKSRGDLGTDVSLS